MNLVRMKCPHCGTANALPGNTVGKTARCCRCRQVFLVKTESASTVLGANPVPAGAPQHAPPSMQPVAPVAPTPIQPPGHGHPPVDPFQQLQGGPATGERQNKRRNLAKVRLRMRKKQRQKNIFLALMLVAIVVIAILVAVRFTMKSYIDQTNELNAAKEAMEHKKSRR